MNHNAFFHHFSVARFVANYVDHDSDEVRDKVFSALKKLIFRRNQRSDLLRIARVGRDVPDRPGFWLAVIWIVRPGRPHVRLNSAKKIAH